jgi:hypothetical protein
MHTQIAIPDKVELYLTDLDNHLAIENHADGVVVRASRNNICRKRKELLIRHLAAEGYIPDRYEWFSAPVGDGFLGVTWIAENRPGLRPWRRWITRRNVCYGCLFILWLLCLIWAARHTHGL